MDTGAATALNRLWGVGGNGAGNMNGGPGRASVRELGIGSFKLANSEIAVARLSSDILLSKSAGESNAGVPGEEYLSSNLLSLMLAAGLSICAIPILAKNSMANKIIEECHG